MSWIDSIQLISWKQKKCIKYQYLHQICIKHVKKRADGSHSSFHSRYLLHTCARPCIDNSFIALNIFLVFDLIPLIILVICTFLMPWHEEVSFYETCWNSSENVVGIWTRYTFMVKRVTMLCLSVGFVVQDFVSACFISKNPQIMELITTKSTNTTTTMMTRLLIFDYINVSFSKFSHIMMTSKVTIKCLHTSCVYHHRKKDNIWIIALQRKPTTHMCVRVCVCSSSSGDNSIYSWFMTTNNTEAKWTALGYKENASVVRWWHKVNIAWDIAW